MAKVLAALLFGASALVAANAAQAEERWPLWYLSLTGGWSQHGTSDTSGAGDIDYQSGLDGGYGFSAGLGYKPPVDGGLFGHSRVEAEMLYTMHDVDTIGGVSADGDMANTAFMANLLFDIPTGTGLTPYLGGGVGLTAVNLDAPNPLNGDEVVFAGQFKAGLAYQHDLIPYVDFMLGYRYFLSQDVEIQGQDVENDFHMVEAGARFNF